MSDLDLHAQVVEHKFLEMVRDWKANGLTPFTVRNYIDARLAEHEAKLKTFGLSKVDVPQITAK